MEHNQLLEKFKPNQVKTKLIDRLAYAHDASIYRLIPQVVVKAQTESEIIELLNHAHEIGTGITFRAGGTSLSGQTVGEGMFHLPGK